jgi:hypothetical protein
LEFVAARQMSRCPSWSGGYYYCCGRVCKYCEVWKNVRCASGTSGSIRQDRVVLAAAGWLIAWWVLIGCGV